MEGKRDEWVRYGVEGNCQPRRHDEEAAAGLLGEGCEGLGTMGERWEAREEVEDRRAVNVVGERRDRTAEVAGEATCVDSGCAMRTGWREKRWRNGLIMSRVGCRITSRDGVLNGRFHKVMALRTLTKCHNSRQIAL